MPTVHVLNESKIANSFRVAQVRGMFDFSAETVRHEMHAALPFEDRDWQIGLIVGPSASGKTSLAQKLWPEKQITQHFDWGSDAMIDAFPKNVETTAVCQTLNAVGFSAPPHWLKPYACLSNGQKFRADLARALCESDFVIFDEFTSVVDRDVAKIGSAAVSKAIKRNKALRFVAVSCHHDIAEWLEPDWMFDCGTNRFEWSLLRRPQIEIEIHECSRAMWQTFRQHHYLNHDIHQAAQCYVATWRDRAVGFCSVIHFPHPSCAKMKREHRTVVLPDFQGIGIGNRLSEFIAQKYTREGWRFISSSSNPAMIRHRSRSPLWKLRRFGRVSPPGNPQLPGTRSFIASNSSKRISASFEFIGSKLHGT